VRAKRLLEIFLLTALLQSFLGLLVADSVCAEDLTAPVSESVPFGSYWTTEMVLTKGQTVHIDLKVTGGILDFYFMDSASYIEFQRASSNLEDTSFHYYPSLSKEDATFIDQNARVPANGTYYFVMANMDNFNTVFVSGRIAATSGGLSELVQIDPRFLVAFTLILVVGTQTALWFRERNEKGFAERMQKSKTARALVGVSGFFSITFASIYWIVHNFQLDASSGGGSWIVKSEPQVVLILLTFVFTAMYVIGLALSKKKERSIERPSPVYLDYREPVETRSPGPFELKYCPNCGRDVSNLIARFCPSCGKALVLRSESPFEARQQVDGREEMSDSEPERKQTHRKLKVQ